MRSKEQSTVQSTGQSTIQSAEQSTAQSTEQSTVQSTEQSIVQSTSSVQSNDTYVYGVGMLAVLAIGVCVFFVYQAKNEKQANDRSTAQHEQKKDQPPKQRHML